MNESNESKFVRKYLMNDKLKVCEMFWRLFYILAGRPQLFYRAIVISGLYNMRVCDKMVDFYDVRILTWYVLSCTASTCMRMRSISKFTSSSFSLPPSIIHSHTLLPPPCCMPKFASGK